MDAMDAGSTRPRASPGDVAMTSETGAQEPLLSLEMAVEDNDGDDHSCVSTTEEAPLLTLLNDTVSQIGMGTFQWALFGLCGMGGAHLTRLSMAAFKLTGVTYEHRLDG